MAIGVTRESPRWYTFTTQINITYIGQFEALLQGLIFFRLNVGSQLWIQEHYVWPHTILLQIIHEFHWGGFI